MANLDELIRFAEDHNFNLTGALTHEDVESLARFWLPEIRFHELERFHPIQLGDFLTLPPEVMASLSEEARDAFRVLVLAAGTPRLFDPPVLIVDVSEPPTGFPPDLLSGTVVNAERSIDEALELPEVNDEAVVSNGTSYNSAIQFFGASDTVSGLPVPTPGDPRVPRHDMWVLAELKMLFETLEYELRVEQAEDYPEDGLRGGFNIVGLLFSKRAHDEEDEEPAFFPRALMVEILLELIAAHEAGDTAAFDEALREIPEGWRFERLRWDAVTGLAFLEFYFFYAYNDYDQYGTFPFENRHEGDVEGCCVVFERDALNAAAGDPDALHDVRPVSLITSVHEEWQGGDRFKALEPVPERDQFREQLRVWVAVGSHATYLRPGTHDFLDFGDVLASPFHSDSWIAYTGPLALAIGLLLAIAEHFVDAEDKTTDDGIHAGPSEEVPPTDPVRFVEPTILVTPLSGPPPEADQPIYSEAERPALRVRAFPGRWGGHDGLINHSSAFENKTGRYFRRLIRELDAHPPIP
jgi:hypothetical protein